MIGRLPAHLGVRGRVRSIRAGAATTPGRLWLLSVLLLGQGALLFVMAASELFGAAYAVDRIQFRTAATVEGAAELHAALADADRSAANALLPRLAETEEPRQHYLSDMQLASRDLEQVAERNVVGERESSALQQIESQLVEYGGLVETARANNRQDFPVGAAYMRRASQLMHRSPDGILAEVDELDALNSADLARVDSFLGLAGYLLIVYFAVVLTMLGTLVYTQTFVRRRFRRRHNPMLLVATGVLLVLATGTVLRAESMRVALGTAEGQAYDRLHLLWQARGLAYDADGNESLSLIAHGNGAQFDAAFQEEMKLLADRPITDGMIADAAAGSVGFRGLLADEIARASFPGERDAAVDVLRAYQRFMAADAKIREQVAAGAHDQAVDIALGVAPGQLGAAFIDLDSDFGDVIRIDQARFDSAMRDASSGIAFNGGLPLLALLAGVLAWLGLRPRIAEYRE